MRGGQLAPRRGRSRARRVNDREARCSPEKSDGRMNWRLAAVPSFFARARDCNFGRRHLRRASSRGTRCRREPRGMGSSSKACGNHEDHLRFQIPPSKHERYRRGGNGAYLAWAPCRAQLERGPASASLPRPLADRSWTLRRCPASPAPSDRC